MLRSASPGDWMRSMRLGLQSQAFRSHAGDVRFTKAFPDDAPLAHAVQAWAAIIPGCPVEVHNASRQCHKQLLMLWQGIATFRIGLCPVRSGRGSRTFAGLGLIEDYKAQASTVPVTDCAPAMRNLPNGRVGGCGFLLTARRSQWFIAAIRRPLLCR